MDTILYNDGTDYKGKKYQKAIPLEWQKKRYANQKFGKLLVECPVWVEGFITEPSHTNAIWLTHCDCGNDYCISMQRIRKEIRKNQIPNCGCIARQAQDDKYIGQTYSYLTVIERDDEYKKQNHFSNTNTYYKCKCKCGNITHVRINTLVAGEVKSCGCLKQEQDKINLIPTEMIDITGQKFGLLTALTPFKNSQFSKQEIWWHCQCDCGNTCDVRGISLRNGDTQSCGCLLKSHGELMIEEILKKYDINFVYDKEYFKDLQLPTGRIGRYDFILLDENNKPYRLIEYDGKQHYFSNEYFGGETEFQQRQTNDAIKNNYAKEHNLPLVRIPYTVKNITYNDLFSDKYII